MPAVRGPDIVCTSSAVMRSPATPNIRPLRSPSSTPLIAALRVHVGFLVLAGPEIRAGPRRVCIVRVRIRRRQNPEAAALSEHRIPESSDDAVIWSKPPKCAPPRCRSRRDAPPGLPAASVFGEPSRASVPA